MPPPYANASTNSRPPSKSTWSKRKMYIFTPMETPGFKLFRKVGNPTKKRSMKISVAEAAQMGWELDEAPKAISQGPKEPYKTPPLPESARNAIPKAKEPEPEKEPEAMPEVKKPTRKKRTPKK